jgi:hypothetical protein
MVRVYPEHRKFTIGKLPEEQRLTCSGSWGRYTNHYNHSNSVFLLMDPRTTVKIVMSGQCHPTTARGATPPMRYGLIEQIEY